MAVNQAIPISTGQEGGGPKPFRFKWDKEAEDILEECAEMYDFESMSTEEYKQSVYAIFQNRINRKPPNVAAMYTQLLKIKKSREEGEKDPINFKWTPAHKQRLLEIGLEMLARKERFKSLHYMDMMHRAFCQEFPTFKGTTKWLSNVFNRVHKEKQKNDAKALKDIVDKVEKQLNDEDLRDARDSDNNFPAQQLKIIERYNILGKEHGCQDLFKGLCCMCAKLLFGESRVNKRWHLINRYDSKYDNCLFSDPEFQLPVESLFEAEQLPPLLPYKIGISQIYICSVCLKLSEKGKLIIDDIDLREPATENKPTPGFMRVPDVLKSITTDLERGLIGLLAVYHDPLIRQQMYQRTFQHIRGEVNVLTKKDQVYLYMYGLIVGRPPKGTKKSIVQQHYNAQKALRWLRRNNPLYRDFYANCETLFGKLKGGSIEEMLQRGVIKTDKADITDELQDEQIGLFVPSDKFQGQDDITEDDFNKHISHPKDIHDSQPLRKQTRVGLFHEHLEAMAFPADYPWGKGSYNPKWKHISHRNYIKFQLLNLDPRFRNNKVLPFFEIDRYIKTSMINHQHFYLAPVGVKAVDTPTVHDLQTKDAYKKFGKSISANIPGSKSFWWNAMQEILAIANHMEREPDYFYTVTSNDSWPEIQKVVKHGPGRSCEDCPHFVNPNEADPVVGEPVFSSISFHERFQLFLRTQIQNEHGEFGKVIRHWYRREYQKRGAVHIHGVVWVEKKKENLVKAEMPRTTSKDPKTIELVKELRELVKIYQTHHHIPDRCFMSGNKRLSYCKYNYPAPLVNTTREDESGLRMLYKRRKEEDKFISPYSYSLLLIMRASVNIQEVRGENWRFYLPKYIAKCEPTSRIPIGGRRIAKDASAPERYLKMKVMGAVEIADISLQFPLKYCNVEVIYLDIPIDFENQPRVLKRADHLPEDPDSEDVYYQTKFEKYLSRPMTIYCKDLTYPQYFARYVFDKDSLRNPYNYDENEYDNETEEIPDPDIYRGNEGEDAKLYDRRGRIVRFRRHEAVIRFQFLMPYGETQEMFCLKLILENRPFNSKKEFINLLKDNNCTSYLDYCAKNGLWNDQTVYTDFLDNAKTMGISEYELRRIAAQLVAGNYISNAQFTSYINEIMQKYLDDREAEDQQEILDGVDNEVDYLKDLPMPNMNLKSLEEYKKTFTEDQRKVFNHITTKVESGEQVLACVSGSAGTGKSHLIKAFIAYIIESLNKSFSILAPTGSAAYQLGGQTVHSKFKMDEKYNVHISPNTVEEWLIKYCDVFLIDEMSMIPWDMMEKIEQTLRQFCLLKDKGKHFGGKHIILFGDPAQLPPKKAPWFNDWTFGLFKHYTINEIVRQQEDREFARILQRVRLGYVDLTTEARFKSRLVTDVEAAKQTSFDENVVIIVGKRDVVDKYNDEIIAKSTEKEYIFEAIDTDLQGGKLNATALKRIRDIDARLPDILKLKKNCLVFVRRNICMAKGLVNGRQAMVEEIYEDAGCIMLKAIDTDDRWCIKRITQQLEDYGEPKYLRVQFPISLGYCATVHRLQGKTLPKAFVAIDDSIFASGQAYVALSRTKRLEDLHLLSFDKTRVFLKDYYKELIRWIENEDELLPPEKKRTDLKLPVWSYDDKFIDSKKKDKKDDKTDVKSEDKKEDNDNVEDMDIDVFEPTPSQQIADQLKDSHIDSQKGKGNKEITTDPRLQSQTRHTPYIMPGHSRFVQPVKIEVPTDLRVIPIDVLSEICGNIMDQMVRKLVFVNNETIEATFRQPVVFNIGRQVIGELRSREILSIEGPRHQHNQCVSDKTKSSAVPAFIKEDIHRKYHFLRASHNGDCFFNSISNCFYSHIHYSDLVRFGALFCTSLQLDRWDKFSSWLFKNGRELCLSLAISNARDKVEKDGKKITMIEEAKELYPDIFIRLPSHEQDQFHFAENAAVLATAQAVNRMIDVYSAVPPQRFMPASALNRKAIVFSLDAEHFLYDLLIPKNDNVESFIREPLVIEEEGEIFYPMDTEDFSNQRQNSSQRQIQSQHSPQPQPDPRVDQTQRPPSTQSSVHSYGDQKSSSSRSSEEDLSLSTKRPHPPTSSSGSSCGETPISAYIVNTRCRGLLRDFYKEKDLIMQATPAKVKSYIDKKEPALISLVKDLFKSAKPRTIRGIKPNTPKTNHLYNIQNHVKDNYVAFNVQGDGNCWYRAISLCLFGTEDYFCVVRFGALIAVNQHWNTYFSHQRTRFFNLNAFCISIAAFENQNRIQRNYSNLITEEQFGQFGSLDNFHWAGFGAQIATSIIVNCPIDLWCAEEDLGGRMASRRYTADVRPIVIQRVGQGNSHHFQSLIPKTSDVNSCHRRNGMPYVSFNQLRKVYYLYPSGGTDEDKKIWEQLENAYKGVHFVLKKNF